MNAYIDRNKKLHVPKNNAPLLFLEWLSIQKGLHVVTTEIKLDYFIVSIYCLNSRERFELYESCKNYINQNLPFYD